MVIHSLSQGRLSAPNSYCLFHQRVFLRSRVTGFFLLTYDRYVFCCLQVDICTVFTYFMENTLISWGCTWTVLTPDRRRYTLSLDRHKTWVYRIRGRRGRTPLLRHYTHLRRYTPGNDPLMKPFYTTYVSSTPSASLPDL